MAEEATSVGTVQLDVEVNQKSLDQEMSKLGKSFNNSFKNMFNRTMGQTNNFVKSSIGRMTNSFKNFTQSGTGSSEKVSKSVERMNAQYGKTESKISEIRKELQMLIAEQNEIVKGYQKFPAFSGMTKEDSTKEMLKSDLKYNELSDQIDKLTSKLNPLIEKNKKLADEINNVGNSAENTGKKINFIGRNSNKSGKDIEKASFKTRLFGDEMKKSGTKSAGFATMIDRTFRTILRRLFIYQTIMKGIRGVMNYMGAALQTNAQFVNSLNIIKTNLMVAFQPIYTFILPALNALMSAVATVTTYIASAISALFGKSYKQSFNAAKGMNQVAKSMGGAGKAAKGAGKAVKKAGEDAKRALAGFDEINNLDLDKGTSDPDTGSGGGGGADGFKMTMPDMSKIDMTGIEKFKEIMSRIFEPFKLAWENEGQATIDAMKYALTGVWGLTKEIGKSWLEVWTNGTGQAILETILRIIQNILGRIGDMARSFTDAWVEGGRGTTIMQYLHNIILNVLTLIERLTESNRKMWGEYGDTLARMFLETLKNILGVFDHLGEKLVWVWDNGGRHLSEGLSRLIVKVIELAGYVLNTFIIPFAHGFIDIAAPAVAGLMDAIGWLLDKFTDLIDWLLGDGKPVLDTIISVLKDMAIAFGIVKGAIIAKNVVLALYNGIMLIATGITSAFKLAIAALTSPFGLAVIAVMGIIFALKKMGVTFDDVKKAVKKFVDKVVEFFQWLYNKLVGNSIIPDLVNGITGWFTDMFKKVKETVSNLVNKVVEFFGNLKAKTIDRVTSMVSSVKDKFAQMRSAAVDRAKAIANNVGSQWNNMKSRTATTFSNMLTTVSSKMNDIRNKIANSKLGQAWSKVWNFKLPKIKMPHFSMRGSFSLLPPSVPRVNVDWYDKGGIFTGPQVIGVGEKRPEFVGALDDLRAIVRDEILGVMNMFGELFGGSDEEGDLVLEIDGDEFARIAIRAINKRRRKAGLPLLQI